MVPPITLLFLIVNLFPLCLCVCMYDIYHVYIIYLNLGLLSFFFVDCSDLGYLIIDILGLANQIVVGVFENI